VSAVIGTPQVPASLRRQAALFWRARLPRERLLLAAGAAALMLFIGWSLLVQPAWNVVRAAPLQLDQLDRQLQQMRASAAEVEALRAVPPVTSAQAAAALKAATARLGDKGRLTLQGERATLTLSGASPEARRAWLGEARSGARARPVEAQLTRAAQGYSGTIPVSLGSAG
jgi:general secretion pathway protein M